MLHTPALKYKYMDIIQLYRALDRLTRIKNPYEKFTRVFNSIISDFLLEPKYNSKQLEELSFDVKKEFVVKIWNESVQK